MSVDQLPPGNASPATTRDAKFVRYDEYIDKQIQATRRMVKTVDIMTALLVHGDRHARLPAHRGGRRTLARPGGFSSLARMLLFVVLFGSLGFYAIAPPLAARASVRSIRPMRPTPSNTTTRRSRTACSTCSCSASSATTSPTPSTKRSKSRRPSGSSACPSSRPSIARNCCDSATC